LSDKAQVLSSGQKNLLTLVVKGREEDGWAPVSPPIYRMLVGPHGLPEALVALEPVGDEGRGRIRLTDEGQKVIDAMAWLS
jgi:hypothetical protein